MNTRFNSTEHPVVTLCELLRFFREEEVEMAETALSMARSILGSAISKAASAAAEEMSLLMGMKKEIWFKMS
ncbi:hypothetical protein EJB05_13834 [Eragrostis curvula]|uniref:Uncharacterized protein n=1 Tax=Eragrostis curvula TaxID=38414 RepID=A0A5J9VXK5_9POAL|nr:hypothetical protein EJB05_13834 [Eragrostis curvula]